MYWSTDFGRLLPYSGVWSVRDVDRVLVQVQYIVLVLEYLSFFFPFINCLYLIRLRRRTSYLYPHLPPNNLSTSTVTEVMSREMA